MLKKLLFRDFNAERRNIWLSEQLSLIHSGQRILDAGAGELKNKKHCQHLDYVSQDFCQYEGKGDGKGLQTGFWDTTRIDLVCDITAIPEPDNSFDVILCSEVFEHIPDPLPALREFARLLKPGGKLILTAPFSSHVHFAPYHFCTGFSKYWYEHHLPKSGFKINELTPNGDWFDMFHQEAARLGPITRKYKEGLWPLAFLLSLLCIIYFKIRREQKPKSADVCCLGWHCLAMRV